MMTTKDHDLSTRLTAQIKGGIAAAGHSQKSLAALMGVSESTVSRWVSHPMRMKICEWCAICKTTGMDVNILSGED